jgi:hypothetical protein
MACIVGSGYVGPVEPICAKHQVDVDELEFILEEAGLELFDLEDGRVFVTIQEKYHLAKEVCSTLTEMEPYTPEELHLIKEYTGSSDGSLKICRLAVDDDSFLDVLEAMESLSEVTV